MMIAEAGLPLFDDINKQTRNKPYYNANFKEWICPVNRYPSFQFNATSAAIYASNLVNIDTGVEVSIKTHLDANYVVTIWRDGIIYNHTYSGDVEVSPVTASGRYYIYIKDDNDYEWWSEVFTITNVTV